MRELRQEALQMAGVVQQKYRALLRNGALAAAGILIQQRRRPAAGTDDRRRSNVKELREL